MGQAKIRGTFEERKAQAIQREHDETEAATLKWASLSPAEKAAYFEKVKRLMGKDPSLA